MLTDKEILKLFQYARNIEIDAFRKWLDTPIYRIMPLEYVLHILEHNELFFQNICKSWEDPYELFVFKQNYTYKGHKLDNSEIIRHHYGQCWSTKMNSDALWRIYSPDMKGVRLKTTPSILLHELFANKEYQFVINYGPVKYFNRPQIEDWLQKNFTGAFSEKYVIDSFFMKRNNFAHESEVRFVITTGNVPAENGVKIKIDPNQVIQQIAFDPRLSDERCKIFKEMLQRYDKPDIKIVKSSMYTMKPLNIKL